MFTFNVGRAIIATFLVGLMAFSSSAQETAAVQPDQVASNDKPPVYVLMKTSLGDMVIELNAERAPISVENFLKYVEEDFYDNTIFHRVIQDFMIQGGGFDKADTRVPKETHAPIKNEAGNGLDNEKYTLAMARTGDPDSATAQFFINTKNNGFLNRRQAQDKYGYTVFGKVIDGKETVDKIAAAEVTFRGGENAYPIRPILITDVTVIEKPEAK